jgi:hypothetical protein
VDFFVGDGEMFDTSGNNDEFAFAHERFAVAEFHAQPAFDNEEELIFVFVMVPNKFALQFHRLDVSLVHLADDPGVAVIGEETEFFLQINCFHGTAYRV